MMKRLVPALLAALPLLGPVRAGAEYRVLSPDDIGDLNIDIEHNGSASFDRLSEHNGQQSHTLEFGAGVTSWWRSELQVSANRSPGAAEPFLVDALSSENAFLLMEQEEHGISAAIYAEYGQSLTLGKHAGPNEFTFGPLIQRDAGRTTHTINLFLTRQLGPNQTTQGLNFSYAWQSRWNLYKLLSPAVEIYGDAGVLGHVPGLARQQILVGPVVLGQVTLGQIGLSQLGELRYEIGWLFGATQASPQGTLRWRVEYELPF